MKILLVDDDVFLRDMYATKFTQAGDAVVTAQTGAEAIELAGKDAFDAILMDMIMPGMSGIELLVALKALPLCKNAKYIVLSNQGEESDIKAAYDHGAIGYIIKAALIPSEVVEKVHTLVS